MNFAMKTLMACVVCGLASGAASGDVIASDTFDTFNGGTGWAAGSGWQSTKVSGGKYSATGSQYRAFDETILPVPGSSFWVYLEVSIASNAYGGIAFHNGGTEVLLFGRDTANRRWGIDGNFVNDTYTDVPWVAGETVVLLGHVEYLTGHTNNGTSGVDAPGNDRVSLWVNPDDLNNLSTNPASNFATVLDNNLGPYTQIRLGTASTALTVDNLIIAEELSDITAIIPEPSSLALLGLGGLMIARRRRD